MRLQALLPTWLPWARKRLALSEETEGQLRAISPRQMDRVLAPDKRRLRRRHYGGTRLFLHFGDVADSTGLNRLRS